MILSRYITDYKANLRLALPVALSQLGYIVVQFADNAMVGAYGGQDPLPLSAVSFGVMISFVMFSLALGLTLGITPIIGEHFARGEYRRTAHYLQSSLVSFPIIGVIFMVLQLLSVPLLYRLGQPVEVVDMAVPYYRLMAYSLPAIMLYGCFKQFLEGMGDTATPMVIAIITNLINVALNWVFIYGHCGYEAMGVYGAGLATLIARYMSPVLIFAYFLIRSKYRDYLKLFSRGVNYLKDTLRLLTIGIPTAGQMLLEGAAFVVTSVMMGWFGAEAIAANQVAMTYGNAAFMITVALGSAATIRTSHCYGLRDMAQMRSAVTASLHLAVLWGVVVLVAFVALRGVLPMAFTPSSEIIALAAPMMVLVALYQVSDAVQGSLIGVLRGMQDVKIIAYLSFVAYILINIPVGYLCAFTFGFGSVGLLVGYVVGLTTAAVAYGVRVHRNLKNEKMFLKK
ncbi:MAG: MATE family efflux transporter [Alistipes sp.]|nr:MATE family efflux transporter [Alistipes sp.]